MMRECLSDKLVIVLHSDRAERSIEIRVKSVLLTHTHTHTHTALTSCSPDPDLIKDIWTKSNLE